MRKCHSNMPFFFLFINLIHIIDVWKVSWITGICLKILNFCSNLKNLNVFLVFDRVVWKLFILQFPNYLLKFSNLFHINLFIWVYKNKLFTSCQQIIKKWFESYNTTVIDMFEYDYNLRFKNNNNPWSVLFITFTNVQTVNH